MIHDIFSAFWQKGGKSVFAYFPLKTIYNSSLFPYIFHHIVAEVHLLKCNVLHSFAVKKVISTVITIVIIYVYGK